ncbi:hypothetical protein NGM37_12535, partial [Streptomyces sp. TRM76130]|nr:hypothetical protein [Streptomyces sp. TRM76130]
MALLIGAPGRGVDRFVEDGTRLLLAATRRNLIADTARALRPGGSFGATYRDLTGELTGPDRFIPVRSTADRILTCFLEYVDDDTVQVHDLLHTRHDEAWHLTASSHPKLRLAPQWLNDQCTASGLEVRHHAVG